jgi:hypothetical protein
MLGPAGPCPVRTTGAGSVDQYIVSGERMLSERPGVGTPTSGNSDLDAHIDRGTVFLRVEARARVDLDQVATRLAASGWLGDEMGDDERGMRGLTSDLVLGVGSDRPVAFPKSMLVRLGEPRRGARGWTVPIEWQAATLTPLFPVFVGRVWIDLVGVSIEGHYAPPFGVIGVVLDRALLGIAARATAKVMVGRFVDALST